MAFCRNFVAFEFWFAVRTGANKEWIVAGTRDLTVVPSSWMTSLELAKIHELVKNKKRLLLHWLVVRARLQ